MLTPARADDLEDLLRAGLAAPESSPAPGALVG
jgi:hypothetical protein